MRDVLPAAVGRNDSHTAGVSGGDGEPGPSGVGGRIQPSPATETVAPSLMNEGTNEECLPDVDVRPNTGIVRSPLDEIKAIRTLLADVYGDAGDGRTLFRELVQNADDAGAQRLGLAVLERGWPDAQNSLLHGPALLVANDGAFPDKDREALHKAIGGSKEDAVDKIGTFGIGLKSVFHICEAFLYMGAEKSQWRAGVLNPWAGTGENGERDPLHPDWDVVAVEDVERLRSPGDGAAWADEQRSPAVDSPTTS